MRIPMFLFIMILSLALLVGCGGPGPVRSALEPDSTLVFGHIDMSESNARIVDVSLMYHPPRIGVYMRRYSNDIHNMRVYESGTFFAENITPGKYRLQGFHSKGGDYYLGDGNEYIITVKKGNLHYLGTYKYKSVKSSRLKLLLLGTGKFGFENVKRPGELELLEEILPYTKETTWEGKIQRRIKQLKKRK